MSTSEIAHADWMAYAACRGESNFTEWPHLDQMFTCAQCPVRAACANYGEQVGSGGVVFGGKPIDRLIARDLPPSYWLPFNDGIARKEVA